MLLASIPAAGNVLLLPEGWDVNICSPVVSSAILVLTAGSRLDVCEAAGGLVCPREAGGSIADPMAIEVTVGEPSKLCRKALDSA